LRFFALREGIAARQNKSDPDLGAIVVVKSEVLVAYRSLLVITMAGEKICPRYKNRREIYGALITGE
jgi:hypothetical protein